MPEALRKCLAHLGPDGVRHVDDSEPANRVLGELFWKGSFGPIAASIKLCESDPLAASFDCKNLLCLCRYCDD